MALAVAVALTACSSPAAPPVTQGFIGATQAARATIEANGYTCSPPATAAFPPSLPPAVVSGFPDVIVCAPQAANRDQIVVIGRADGSVAGVEVSALDLADPSAAQATFLRLTPLMTAALTPVLSNESFLAVNSTILSVIKGTTGYVAAGPPGLRVAVRSNGPTGLVIDVAADDLAAAATR